MQLLRQDRDFGTAAGQHQSGSGSNTAETTVVADIRALTVFSAIAVVACTSLSIRSSD